MLHGTGSMPSTIAIYDDAAAVTAAGEQAFIAGLADGGLNEAAVGTEGTTWRNADASRWPSRLRIRTSVPPDVRLHVLGKVPFFAGLQHEGLHQVEARCKVRGLTAGESVYLEGGPATQLYVVATGAVKTTLISPDDRETLLDLLVPGDFLAPTRLKALRSTPTVPGR